MIPSTKALLHCNADPHQVSYEPEIATAESLTVLMGLFACGCIKGASMPNKIKVSMVYTLSSNSNRNKKNHLLTVSQGKLLKDTEHITSACLSFQSSKSAAE